MGRRGSGDRGAVGPPGKVLQPRPAISRHGKHPLRLPLRGNTSKTLVVPDAFVTPNCVLRLVAMSAGREVQGSSSYFDLEPGSRAVWSVGITGLTTPVSLVPPAG